MATLVTIHPTPFTVSQEPVTKFKLVDQSGVLHKNGTPRTDPVPYDDAAAALTAGTTLFAVGQEYDGQKITACTVLSDRIELTLGE